jgi:hypothetical protein
MQRPLCSNSTALFLVAVETRRVLRAGRTAATDGEPSNVGQPGVDVANMAPFSICSS